jgi:hypothetical protein
MALLNGLKLVAAKRSTNASPVVQRRQKMLKQLDEQLCLAKAIAAGTTYAPEKQKKVLNAETGERVSVTVAKRVKQWWWCDGGKCNISVRYGARVIELAKGKNAVEVAEADVLATLELIKQAVEAGELDSAIQAASQTVRANAK